MGHEIKLALGSRGLARGSVTIDQLALRDVYLTRFQPILNILPEAMPYDWLESIARKHRKAFAPLHHILVRLLIDSLPLTGASNPFGIGPWECRNQMAKHFGQSVITNCKLHKESGKAIGVFRCSCGYIFSTAPEPGSRMRILDLGPQFEARLRKLVASAASLRGAAKELYVDPNTVLRYVAVLSLKVPWKARSVRSKSPLIERDEMRSAWTAGHASAQSLPRQQLRSKIPALYTWLYRNDHDWLVEQPPAASRQIPNKPRRDWPSIDAATVQTLQQEAAQLRMLNPPKPITRLALECALGQPGWLEKRMHKLPVCANVLLELTESVEDFQCRRVIWAALELQKQSLPVQMWRLRRLAGLPEKCTAKVKSLFVELANEI